MKELQAKWTRLTEYYKKAPRRRQNKSGDPGNKKLATCEFFDQLAFIDAGIASSADATDNFTPIQSLQHRTDTPVSQTAQTEDDFHVNEIKASTYSTLCLSRRKKRTYTNSEQAVDVLLAKALTEEHEDKVEDETDVLFCKSLVSSFKELNARNKKRARVKILQVFCELDEE